jgi:hypothetical protein
MLCRLNSVAVRYGVLLLEAMPMKSVYFYVLVDLTLMPLKAETAMAHMLPRLLLVLVSVSPRLIFHIHKAPPILL